MSVQVLSLHPLPPNLHPSPGAHALNILPQGCLGDLLSACALRSPTTAPDTFRSGPCCLPAPWLWLLASPGSPCKESCFPLSVCTRATGAFGWKCAPLEGSVCKDGDMCRGLVCLRRIPFLAVSKHLIPCFTVINAESHVHIDPNLKTEPNAILILRCSFGEKQCCSLKCFL